MGVMPDFALCDLWELRIGSSNPAVSFLLAGAANRTSKHSALA
jgi:hypothetical protein